MATLTKEWVDASLEQADNERSKISETCTYRIFFLNNSVK